MANASVAAALSLEPEDPAAHFMYGASFWGLRQFDEAEREYLIAMKDPDNRKDSLAELSRAMLDSGRKEKAKLYVDMLTKEYPDFARGWWLQALVGTPGLIADIRKYLETFLAKADPKDPYYAADVIDAKRWLERMKFDVLRTGGTW
jgi:tetratricopeptide (TPR) repeat protein